MQRLDKQTIVLGVSTNPTRYSYMATESLQTHGHTVYPVGRKVGTINNSIIINNWIDFEWPNIHTITFYLNSKNQLDFEEFALGLKPKRFIFNPGAENIALFKRASELGIECLEACTLVMLSTNQF